MARDLTDILSKISELPSYEVLGPLTPNSKDCLGAPPLHVAAVRGDMEAIQVLARAGAEINAQGEYGYTPLHEAAGRKHKEAFEFLISLGADTTIKNDWGQTALDLKYLKNEDTFHDSEKKSEH